MWLCTTCLTQTWPLEDNDTNNPATIRLAFMSDICIQTVGNFEFIFMIDLFCLVVFFPDIS